MASAAATEIRSLARAASGNFPREPAAGEGAQGSVPGMSGINFIEGARKLRQHIRIERNSQLRKFVLGAAEMAAGAGGVACDCCGLRPSSRYPWSTSALLDVHHVLPLASPARPNARGTSFAGVVLICPNCHRAVHTRYRIYLADQSANDFKSTEEAVDVYNDLKRQIRSDAPATGSGS